MSKPINIKQSLKGVWAEIARVCDLSGEGSLDNSHGVDEISIFNRPCEDYKKNKLFSVNGRTYSIFENKQGKSSGNSDSVEISYKAVDITEYKHIEKNDNIRTDMKTRAVKDVSNQPNRKLNLKETKLVKKLNVKAEKEIKAIMDDIKKLHDAFIKLEQRRLSENDYRAWATEIREVSSSYNIDPKLIIAIIAKEVELDRNTSKNRAPKGPMQVTEDTIADFVPKNKGWHELYKIMNAGLLEDILDSGGNDSKSIHKKCANDSTFGIKVGLFALQMKYLKTRGANNANFESKVNNIKQTHLRNYKEILRKTFELYNASPSSKSYANTIIRYLEKMGYDFTKEPFFNAK